MRPKLLAIGIAVLGSLGILYLIWPEWFGFCEKMRTVTQGDVCRAPYAALVGRPALPFVLSFLIASIIALFSTRKTHHRWAWFTLWYGCIAALLMLLAVASELDIGMFTIPLFDREKVAWLLAGLYGFISLCLLGISDVLVRRKG